MLAPDGMQTARSEVLALKSAASLGDWADVHDMYWCTQGANKAHKNKSKGKKGRWGGEENVDAVSSVSQPLCQLFNLWPKLKSLALAIELAPLNKCSPQGRVDSLFGALCGGRGWPFLGNPCIQYKSAVSTNKLLPWALPHPSCLPQARCCFTRVLYLKWWTTVAQICYGSALCNFWGIYILFYSSSVLVPSTNMRGLYLC